LSLQIVVKTLLRDLTTNDLPTYEQWCRDIDASQYMSRRHPQGFHSENVEASDLYVWYVIEVDGMGVGAIWLEKDHGEDTSVTLGILIGEQAKLGQGIGRAAIELGIKEAHSRLDFDTVQLNVRKSNTRAIRCYESCGFSLIREGDKIGQHGEKIPFLEMSLSSPATSTRTDARSFP
jgi:RimJ/RimL family protein N-acetyltransferase